MDLEKEKTELQQGEFDHEIPIGEGQNKHLLCVIKY